MFAQACKKIGPAAIANIRDYVAECGLKSDNQAAIAIEEQLAQAELRDQVSRSAGCSADGQPQAGGKRRKATQRG